MLNHAWLAASQALFLFSYFLSVHAATNSHTMHVLGPQGVNLWKLNKAQNAKKGTEIKKRAEFPELFFEQPLDHFDKSVNQTWRQRYWISTRHYKPGAGGPVIVLDGGETSGEDRLPYLDTGIVEILTNATGGVGVVLEHRYYGTSIPVSNFSTDSLRWLNNEQALTDSANFMANVKFDGINEDLTAPSTPWIYYGGSYAGARSAHMKVLYPELVYGAIASSGVTHAAVDDWQYMDVIRKAANRTCSNNLVNSIATVDAILAHGPAPIQTQLKSLFNITSLAHDDDFVSLLQSPLGAWQSKNWDPAVGSTEFDTFCVALSTPVGNVTAAAAELPYDHPSRMVPLGNGFSLDFTLVNYATWIKQNVVSSCSNSLTQEECFGTYNDTQYQDIGIDQDWRLWQFQVCTQWGYFMTAPPDPLLPTIISRLLTLPYESKICKQAFLPGQYFKVPALPNVTAVNALGDFAIAADRLAIIDGEVDPWRPDTPHSDDAKPRKDTTLRPFKLIPNAVHHWDENGLSDPLQEPPEIRQIHGETIAFVKEWLKDWKPPKKT